MARGLPSLSTSPPLMPRNRLLGFFLRRYRLRLNRSSIFCVGYAGRCAVAGLRLEPHHQRGARAEFPPLFDVLILGEPERGPAQCGVALLKSLGNPGAQPRHVATILLHGARHIRHATPRTLWRLCLVIRGQLVIAHGTPRPRDERAAPSRCGVPLAKNPLTCSPRCVSHALPWWPQDAMILPNGHDTPTRPCTQCFKNISAFALQPISQHDFTVESPLCARVNELNCQLGFGVIWITLLSSRARFKDLKESREWDLIHDPIRMHRDNPMVALAQIADGLPCHLIRRLPFFRIAGFLDTEAYGPVAHDLLHELAPFGAEGGHLPWRIGQKRVSRWCGFQAHGPGHGRQRFPGNRRQQAQGQILQRFTTAALGTERLVVGTILVAKAHGGVGRSWHPHGGSLLTHRSSAPPNDPPYPGLRRHACRPHGPWPVTA
jgi:hypothetical protein